jgi:ribosomal protein uS2
VLIIRDLKMPRKKKETKVENKVEESIVEETKTSKKEEHVEEPVEKVNIKEIKAEDSEEIVEKTKKKRVIKKLSEDELKRVMTDTKETLVPLTDYIACSVHLGTKVITPDMRKYVYKRRADGLAVLNTNYIDDNLRDASKFLSSFLAKDIFVAGKREALWPAIDKFSEVTGIRAFTKKYPSGIITNIDLDNFFEAKLVILCDPWVDKNAMNDAIKVQTPILAICDSNNYTKGVTKIIPSNNKSRRSVGLILYILAREYLKSQSREDEAKSLNYEDFTGKVEIQEINSQQSEQNIEEAERKIKERLAKISDSTQEGV